MLLKGLNYFVEHKNIFLGIIEYENKDYDNCIGLLEKI